MTDDLMRPNVPLYFVYRDANPQLTQHHAQLRQPLSM